MFNVIKFKLGGEPVVVNGDDGKPLVFEDGKSAAAYARDMAGSDPDHRYQVRKAEAVEAASEDWREREERRFEDGTYQRLVWAVNGPYSWQLVEKKFPDLFAHVAKGKGAMVAYTENEQKGREDKQLRVTPRVFADRFIRPACYPNCSDRDWEDTAGWWVRMFMAVHSEVGEVKFATTADEWEDVYTSGPNSCMAHSADEYSSPFHPVRIYAMGGDLQLAYAEMQEGEDGDCAISVRCIVWPAKKVRGRIYSGGSSELSNRFAAALEALGYRQGSFAGAKIGRVEAYDDEDREDGLVMPYLDEPATHFIDMGDHCVLSEGKGTRGDSTNGVISTVERAECDYTGRWVRVDDLVEVYRIDYRGRSFSESWCRDAVEDWAILCDVSGDYWRSEDVVTLADGRDVNRIWADANCGVCDHTGDLYEIDELTRMADGSYLCADAYRELECFEHTDGEHYRGDERENLEGGEGDDAAPDEAVDAVPAAQVSENSDVLFRAGDVVECLSTAAGQFTSGSVYVVKADFSRADAVAGRHLRILRDDAGGAFNGWVPRFFRKVEHATLNTPVGAVVALSPCNEIPRLTSPGARATVVGVSGSYLSIRWDRSDPRLDPAQQDGGYCPESFVVISEAPSALLAA